MSFLATVVRILVALLLLRLLFRFAAAVVRGYRAPARPRVKELARDRVCGTFVEKEGAISAEVAGRLEHFCSATCRDRALAGGPAAPMEAGRG